MIERTCGLYTRENAGMSSERHARNMPVESPRFPGEGSSTQGKSGPKPRTEVVGDGQQVYIRAITTEISSYTEGLLEQGDGQPCPSVKV